MTISPDPASLDYCHFKNGKMAQARPIRVNRVSQPERIGAATKRQRLARLLLRRWA
jgi:hypothetical protein